MTVNELIAHLEEFKACHGENAGNMPVYVANIQYRSSQFGELEQVVSLNAAYNNTDREPDQSFEDEIEERDIKNGVVLVDPQGERGVPFVTGFENIWGCEVYR